MDKREFLRADLAASMVATARGVHAALPYGAR